MEKPRKISKNDVGKSGKNDGQLLENMKR